MTSDEAWSALVAANQEEDLDDFKVFFLEYVRNNKELTFVDLENKFREEALGVYLIAMVFPLIVIWQVRKKKFHNKKQSVVFKERPAKSTLSPSNLVQRTVVLGNSQTESVNGSATRGQIASTPEGNLERLADAGFLVEDLIPVCFNCNVKGHGKSECPEPPEGPSHLLLLMVEPTRNTPIVMCINCGAEGHRMRDCPDERKDFSHNPDLTCRNCKSIPSHPI
jgi:hypothetical protein